MAAYAAASCFLMAGCSGEKDAVKTAPIQSSNLNRSNTLDSSTVSSTTNVAGPSGAGVEPPTSNMPPQPKSLAERANRKPRVDVDPTAKQPPISLQKAPENSQFGTKMEDDGSLTELRVFKNHPQIAKVEARGSDAKYKTLSVYLRDGNVVSVKTDRVKQLHSAPTKLLLEIVGR